MTYFPKQLSSTTDSVSVHGDVGVVDQLDLTNSNPTAVAIVDGNGDQITSLTVDNGGTFVVQENGAALTSLQLIDDTITTTASPITAKGVAISGTDGTNARIVKTDTSGELQVDVLTMPTVTVDSELPAAGALADATANPTTTSVGNLNLTFNGTTWDRTINVTNGMNTTGTGVQAAGLVGQLDDTSTGSVTENQFAPVRISTRRALLVEGVASGTAQPMSVASGGIASGAIASGAIASGAIAAGAIAAGATSIADNEDTASANGDRLVKVAAIRVDTPVANANVSANGDYLQFALDNTQKLWVAGAYAEDTAHADADRLHANGVRRIDTAASSAGTSGDYATMDASAEGAVWTTLTPTTTSGCTLFRSIDLDETEEDVKASAGNLYGYYFANTASSARYLKLYNAAAASVTVGTTTPVATFYLPATSAGHIGLPFPITFSTAICAAATTGVADNDTGAPGNNEVIFMAFYK